MKLSDLQMISILCATQVHETRIGDDERAWFLLGDKTDTRKGHTIVGIIWKNWLRGKRKSV